MSISFNAPHPGKITVDVLDPDSILQAIKDCKKYNYWQTTKRIELTHRLADEAALAAKEVFAPFMVNVYVEYRGGSVVICAKGREVCFIEFGTGVYADPGHPFADSPELGFVVMPGSWSSTEGEGTWEKWINSGKSAYTYPYNGPSFRGMLAAYNRILQRFNEIAREVFTVNA